MKAYLSAKAKETKNNNNVVLFASTFTPSPA